MRQAIDASRSKKVFQVVVVEHHTETVTLPSGETKTLAGQWVVAQSGQLKNNRWVEESELISFYQGPYFKLMPELSISIVGRDQKESQKVLDELRRKSTENEPKI